MNFSKFLKEEAALGSVGAASIAGFHQPMIGGKPVTRSKPNKKLKIQKLKLGENNNPEFNHFDVKSKMTNAERTDKLKKDSVAYGIEDEEGNITKVYIDKAQEHDFKRELSNLLRNDDKLDIAEILFDLRNTFNILFVDWPNMVEDEETENVLDKDKEGEDGEGGEPKPGEEGPEGPEGEPKPGEEEPKEGPLPEPAPPAEPDSESILLKVIDMLRADAEAKRAESVAKAKESEAETAKFSVQLSNIKVKNEEDMLKADEYFKKQADEKREKDRIAKLAKYRNEVVKNTTYEADMSFLQTIAELTEEMVEPVVEDTNTDVQMLQTRIADINSRKMRAMKVYDDQLRLLQQQLAAKTKQSQSQQDRMQQQTQQMQQTQQ
jgi:hypothetical protein